MIVLNFHGIGDPKKAGRTLEPNEERVWVSIDIFEQILDGLGRLGDDVKLTFDDGNVSDVSVALPRLIEPQAQGLFFPHF